MTPDSDYKPSLVSIAGGTGRYPLLEGVRDHYQVTALYNITDSGGSSEILRVEHGTLPPGDGTQALAALTEDPDHRLFLLDRFTTGRVDNHRIANLMYEVACRKFGGDVGAMKYLARLFQVRGQVLPISLARGVHLIAQLEDGTTLEREDIIDNRGSGSPIVDARLSSPAHILPETEQCLRSADLIIFGPGDLWTSVIPHLLVTGVPEAIQCSLATKIMMCNLATKPGETDGYTASDFARFVVERVGGKLDYLFVNSNHIDQSVKTAYANQGQQLVVRDGSENRYAHHVVEIDLVTMIENGSGHRLLRHDPDKTNRAISLAYHKDLLQILS